MLQPTNKKDIYIIEPIFIVEGEVNLCVLNNFGGF